MRLSSSVALVASTAAIAALLPVVAVASAGAVPMCQGHRATIVGNPANLELNGTAGDDVIVTRGVGRVLAGGGSDRICVTGRRDDRTYIDAGPGDDRVRVATSRTGLLDAFLGEGDDRMVVSTSLTSRVWALDGGGGFDTAYGSKGRDVCRAEVRRGCEH